MHSETISFRPPEIDDGVSIWQLVHDSGVLDLNSTYCYLLLCQHNRETCAVAESQGKIVGFVTAYLPPGRTDTLFVWQIGIIPALRGRGLASRLLMELLQRGICCRVRYLEATVGASNQASRSLFQALAKKLESPLSEQPGFDAGLFPNGEHEPEYLFRIGPFSPNRQNQIRI